MFMIIKQWFSVCLTVTVKDAFQVWEWHILSFKIWDLVIKADFEWALGQMCYADLATLYGGSIIFCGFIMRSAINIDGDFSNKTVINRQW